MNKKPDAVIAISLHKLPIESGVFLLLAGVLLLLAPGEIHRGLLSPVDHAYILGRSSIVEILLTCYGTVLLVLAISSYTRGH